MPANQGTMKGWTRRVLALTSLIATLDPGTHTVSAFVSPARLGLLRASATTPERVSESQHLPNRAVQGVSPLKAVGSDGGDVNVFEAGDVMLSEDNFDENDFEDAPVNDDDDDDGVWWEGLNDDGSDTGVGEGGGGGGGVASGVEVFDAGGAGTRANPKLASKGASILPSKVKRPAIPIVAILGRPNVGKSMIANRISGRYNRGAITNDEVGVTRDRTYLRSEFCGKIFDVVDTGGLVFDDDASQLFLDQIRHQASIALTEACAAVLVVDGQVGWTPMDEAVARFLRKEWASKLQVVVAVNKCESYTQGEVQAADFYKLGLGQPMPCSGIHGNGIAEMLEAIVPVLYDVTEDTIEAEEVQGARTVSVALVGRPNVGKSSLFNRLFGESRAMVSDIAGTTRDTLDAEVEMASSDPGGEKRVYKFIDTAGIRRKGKVEYGNEFFMVNRALKAIRRSDVVLLVLDAVMGVSDQDRVLAQRITDDGRACVVLLNKWDAVTSKDENTYLKSIEYVRDALPAVKWAPVLLVSALTGQRCPKIYSAIDEAVKSHRTRVATATLNQVIRDAIMWQPPPMMASNKGAGKVYYANQISHSPPTIALFCNKPGLFTENYRRYLERKIRESLRFVGTPLKFVWRGKRVRTIDQENRRSAKQSGGPGGAAPSSNAATRRKDNSIGGRKKGKKAAP